MSVHVMLHVMMTHYQYKDKLLVNGILEIVDFYYPIDVHYLISEYFLNKGINICCGNVSICCFFTVMGHW